jgi:hypothetical protein
MLGGVVTDAAHPQLAAAPDGAVHLVYQGRVGESSVIAHRVLRDGVWSDEAIVSATEEDQASPGLAVSADGTVHAIWSEKIEGRWAVIHSAQQEEGWGSFHILSGDSAGDSQYPSIAARPDGGAEVVWQTVRGSGYLVSHASLSPGGEATVPEEIGCQSLDGYNVYPQVFLTPVPVICWHEYEAGDGDFALRSAELVPGTGWRRMPLEDLLLVNPSRLPSLLLSDVGGWAALWYDVAPQHDRIIFGRGGEPEFGSGVIVDENPDFENDWPSAASIGGDLWAVTWRGNTPLGPEIFLAVDSDDGWLQRILTDGQTPAAAQPALCATGGAIHVVWTSDLREGGSGSLTHMVLTLP